MKTFITFDSMLYQTRTYKPSTIFIKTCTGQPKSGKKVVQMFNSVDPMADKYPSLSPYAYCANNPLRYTDPTGMVVETTEEGVSVLKNTVSKKDAKYIRLTKDGTIDQDHLNKSKTNTGNMGKLKYMVNHESTIQLNISDKYDYVDENGSLNPKEDWNLMPPVDVNPNIKGAYTPSTGEVGYTGNTQFPGRESNTYNSPNDKIIVTINSSLSEQGKAEVTGHELYGHAFLKTIGHTYPYHMFNKLPISGPTDVNVPLRRAIISSMKEIQGYFNNRRK